MSQPEDLAGIYAPRYLGNSLLYFFNHIDMRIWQGNIPINLMDYFPHLKQGYALRNTLTLMMYSYINLRSLQDMNVKGYVKPDSIFNKSFNDDIPADFYTYRNENGTFTKILMQKAVNKGLIVTQMNTFQMIKTNKPMFNAEMFNTYFIQNIYSINVYSAPNVPEFQTLFNNADFANEVINECKLANDIFELTNTIKFKENTRTNNPLHVNLREIISLAMDTCHMNIIHEFKRDNWIKLLHAIIINDTDRVISALHDVDPRINNNEAYRLALDVNNKEIIDLIADIIVKKNWLEMQVFIHQFELITPESNLPKVIHKYSRMHF